MVQVRRRLGVCVLSCAALFVASTVVWGQRGPGTGQVPNANNPLERLFRAVAHIEAKLDGIEKKLDTDGAGLKIEAKLDDPSSGLGALHDRIARIEAKLDDPNGDRTVEAKLDAIEGKLDGLENKADHSEVKLDGLIERIVILPGAVGAIEAKLDKIESKADHGEVKLDHIAQALIGPDGASALHIVEAKLDRIETKLDDPNSDRTLEAKLDTIEAKLDDGTEAMADSFFDVFTELRTHHDFAVDSFFDVFVELDLVNETLQPVGGGIRALEAKLDGLENKADHAEAKLDEIRDVLFDPIGSPAIAQLELKLDILFGIIANPPVGDALQQIEAKLDTIEKKLDGTDTGARSIEAKLDALLNQ